MSRRRIGGIGVDLELLTAKFEAGFKRADQSFKRFDTATKRMQRSLDGINRSFSRAQRAVLAIAGASGFGALYTKSIQAADGIGKTADKLGLGVEALQEYRFAAEQSGVQVSTFDMAIQRLGRRFAEADRGTGEAVKALQELGVATRDSEGNLKTIEQLLPELAERFGRVGNQLDRNRLAMRLFDSEGVVMVNLLRNGAQGMGDLRTQARESGMVLSEDLVRGAEKANDQFNLMKRVVGAQITRAMVALSPIITQVGQAFADAAPKVAAFFGSFGTAEDMSDDALDMAIDRVDRSLTELEQRYQRAKTLMANEDTASGPEIFGTLLGNYDPEKIRQQIAERKAIYDELVEMREFRNVDAGLRPKQKPENPFEGLDFGLPDMEAQTARQRELNELLDEAIKQQSDMEAAYDQRVRSNRELVAELSEEVRLSKLSERERFVQIRLGKLSAEATDEQRQAVEGYAAALFEADEAQKRMADEGDSAFRELKTSVKGWGRSFADAMLDGERSFGNFAESMTRQLARIALTETFNPFFSMFGDWIGGAAKNVFPGFAYGGRFTVGGTGGTDSKLAAFRVTPGETISVDRPNKVNGDSPVMVAPTNQVQVNVVNQAPNSKAVTREREENGVRVIDVLIEQVKTAIAGDISRGAGAVPNALQGTYGLNRVAGAY